jgi:hypothetical protein
MAVRAKAAAIKPFAIALSGVAQSAAAPFRSVTIESELSTELTRARTRFFAAGATPEMSAGATGARVIRPHLSVLYGTHSDASRADAASEARKLLNSDGSGELTFTATKLLVVATSTADYCCWPVAASIDL